MNLYVYDDTLSGEQYRPNLGQAELFISLYKLFGHVQLILSRK